MPHAKGSYNSLLINFLIDPKYRIGRHLLLILFFIFVSFNVPYFVCSEFLDQTDHMLWYVSLLLLVSYLGGIYLHLYVLLPQLLLKNRYVLYAVSLSLLILTMVLVSFGADCRLNGYYGQVPGHYSYFYKNRMLWVEVSGNFFFYGVLLAGTSFTVFLRRWMQYSKRKNELEKENLKTELECLKDRINPEFLFGMLDEAGRRTLDEPEEASGILIGLSKLLRYQLYDGKREKVLLISEIAFIENFFRLAKMRYANLSFAVEKEGDVSRKLVPPLLFIPFAFHYVKLLPANGMRMDIRFNFRAERQKLYFTSICFTPGMRRGNRLDSRELTDVRHRLDLLFKGSYTLGKVDEGSVCKMNVCIGL